MDLISERLSAGPTLSFEFFPPKTPAGLRTLQRTIDQLETLSPSFISVTYGAGGSTRDTTRNLVVEQNTARNYPAMAHLTCVGHTADELRELLEDYRDHGVLNILALAGDPSSDAEESAVGTFEFAADLVELIRSTGDFSIGVAAHPELHPRSADRATDRRYLAHKLALADFGVTQFFFDAEDYFAMVDELDALGVTKPVLPGIMPVVNPVSVRRFADMANAKRPQAMWDRLDSLTDDPDALLDAAVDFSCELISDLLEVGVPGIHLYALNKPEASLAICERLGLRG
jgi:methylenetetrahydrofolate reductase (NADPH)